MFGCPLRSPLIRLTQEQHPHNHLSEKKARLVARTLAGHI